MIMPVFTNGQKIMLGESFLTNCRPDMARLFFTWKNQPWGCTFL